jgi:molybdate transport system permease protein
MDSSVRQALLVSLEVAAQATALAALPAVALGWFLARARFPGRFLLEALVALPLVLPPTAVGFLLLELFAREGLLGERVLGFDPGVLLSRRGAVLASALMALPLFARSARSAFEGVPPRLEWMARSLGYSRGATFARVSLPLARRGLVAGGFLAFGRALGEFGATVVVAGSIPGRTRTLALALFDEIQLGRAEKARALLFVAATLSFALVLAAELCSPRPKERP